MPDPGAAPRSPGSDRESSHSGPSGHGPSDGGSFHRGPSDREYPARPIVSAHAVVVRDEAVLLVKRAHPPGQGRWSLPGGMVELGETIREAVRREVREECGIEIEAGPVVDVADGITRDEAGRVRFHYVVVYLLARYVAGEARPGEDAAAVMWAAPGDLAALDMHPAVRSLIVRTAAGR